LGDNENCTICMTSYESPCPTCKMPGDDCPPIEGSCSHFFHLHCIYKWLESGNPNCPLDREPWSEKTVSSLNPAVGSSINSNSNNNIHNNNNI
jgi:anaphase-promoting complex subunit 11